MEQIAFGTDNFAENPDPRVPCILLLDVSSSMTGEPIAQLNEGLKAYQQSLQADSLALKRVEVCVITFGQSVEVVTPFTIASQFTPPELVANGLTPMGTAVNKAIDELEARKSVYRENGIAYMRPWLFLISDGEPNDVGWESAAARSVAGEQAKSFAMFCVGVGSANLNTLKMFTIREPLRLKGLEFSRLFQWLSSSQQSASRSTPGEEVPLQNPATPDGWASIG